MLGELVATPSSKNSLIEVTNLKMYFPVTRGLFRLKVADVKAIDDISFKVTRGETLGLVGESGCGKTTVGRCILRVYRPTDGNILFEGHDISKIPQDRLRKLRRRMQLIFQDPYGSLDPRQSAGSIVSEGLKIHKMFRNKRESQQRIENLFRIVGLDPGMADRVPHEFSGGQRQRIGIARALACEPTLIICDEPVSALDVSIQAQIINLLEELQDKLALTYLFISHDLSVVRHICDRVAVMYLGRLVEISDRNTLYEDPMHPYTKALLSAIPIPDPTVEESRERIILKGDLPSPLNPPAGCSFNTRCPIAIDECRKVVPELREIGHNHSVACIRA